MLQKEDAIQLEITDEMIDEALTHALQMSFLDNLRNRAPFVQFDSKLRGYLGEIAMKKLILESGVSIVSVDSSDGSGEDIDMCIENDYINNIRIEIKTSCIPDIWKNLDMVIQKADIKIIKRESSYKDIKADIHIQIYFNQWRKKRDEMLSAIKGVPSDYLKKELIEIMELKQLKQVFIAWIDKGTLIKNLSNKKIKTWQFGYRSFWSCPLTETNKPKEMMGFLKNYKGIKSEE